MRCNFKKKDVRNSKNVDNVANISKSEMILSQYKSICTLPYLNVSVYHYKEKRA